MPEENKETIKKPNDVFAEIAYYLLPLLFLTLFFSYISANTKWFSFLIDLAEKGAFLIIALAVFTLSVSVSLYIFFSYKLSFVLAKEQANFNLKQIKPDQVFENKRWDSILQYMTSDHPNDWRIAILEADIILNEILTKSGYTGDTVADKLKQVEKSDFQTLENAWEAHKVRNKVVHDKDFLLSKREAKRIMDLYQSVFEEFEFI
jgi:hypothetical protein